MRNGSRHWVVVEGGGGGVQRTGERCDAMTGVKPCHRGGGGGTSECRRRLGAPPQPRGVGGQLVRLEGAGYRRWRWQADGR
jgi:hypothetical protein